MVIIKAEDINMIYYYNFNYIHAVTNINLEIEKGEFVVITGLRESGKTTLIRMLGGFARPSSGKVYLNSRDIYSLSDMELASLYRKEIGFIFQNYQLINGLTIYDNILLPCLLNHDSFDKNFLRELTEGLHIADILYSYPGKISEQQKQCVAIARALVNQPEIIFADEPTKNLNNELSKDILDFLMNYINWHHRTMIMVTHDPEISVFADHIIQLDMGKVVSDRKIKKVDSRI